MISLSLAYGCAGVYFLSPLFSPQQIVCLVVSGFALIPSLPFHNLGEAHRRLMTGLPPDSPYRRLVYPSAWAVLRELYANAYSAKLNSQPASMIERPSPTAGHAAKRR